MTLLNYKFRLYPTKEQELVLEQTLDGCRWVYNYFLSLPSPMSEYDMNYALTELKEQHPWLRNYHSKMLQMVCKQVAAARRAARGRKKKPSYLRLDDFNSFTYYQSGFRLEDSKNRLSLSKMGCGSIRIVLHRKPLNVKQVTICRKNSRWYAVVACEVLRRTFSPIVKYKKKPVAMDGSKIKSSNDFGDCAEDKNPQILRKMLLNPLRRAHRRVSRRQVGSRNHKKARHMLARLYERIHNKRKDFLCGRSLYCVSSRYDPTIFVDRLQVANLTRKHRLAKKILDASWSTTFENLRRDKANRVVETWTAYTSVNYSRSLHCLVPKSLAIRAHVCTKCKVAVPNRDYHASLTLLQRRLEFLTTLLLLPVERREVTPVEIAVQRSVKQEEAIVSGHG